MAELQIAAGVYGQPHIYSIISDGHQRVLGSKEVGVVVKSGGLIYCLSAGGGGYGEPEALDQTARDRDVKNGYVTVYQFSAQR